MAKKLAARSSMKAKPPHRPRPRHQTCGTHQRHMRISVSASARVAVKYFAEARADGMVDTLVILGRVRSNGGSPIGSVCGIIAEAVSRNNHEPHLGRQPGIGMLKRRYRHDFSYFWQYSCHYEAPRRMPAITPADCLKPSEARRPA